MLSVRNTSFPHKRKAEIKKQKNINCTPWCHVEARVQLFVLYLLCRGDIESNLPGEVALIDKGLLTKGYSSVKGDL